MLAEQFPSSGDSGVGDTCIEIAGEGLSKFRLATVEFQNPLALRNLIEDLINDRRGNLLRSSRFFQVSDAHIEVCGCLSRCGGESGAGDRQREYSSAAFRIEIGQWVVVLGVREWLAQQRPGTFGRSDDVAVVLGFDRAFHQAFHQRKAEIAFLDKGFEILGQQFGVQTAQRAFHEFL